MQANSFEAYVQNETEFVLTLRDINCKGRAKLQREDVVLPYRTHRIISVEKAEDGSFIKEGLMVYDIGETGLQLKLRWDLTMPKDEKIVDAEVIGGEKRRCLEIMKLISNREKCKSFLNLRKRVPLAIT